MNAKRFFYTCVGLVGASMVVTSAVWADNPDGRPSITITAGAQRSNNFTEATASGISVTGNKYNANLFGPNITLRIPASRSVTYFVDGWYSRYNADLGTVESGGIVADVKQKANTFGGSLGLRFYFGQPK